MKNNNALKTQETTAIQPARTALESKGGMAPVFVEAEKMLERLAEITGDITKRAYDFFRERGGEFGKEVEDWFRAENELLRPVPVEITEADGNIFVRAAVAGFKPEEIEVSVKDNMLFLSGTTEAREEKKEAETIVREWRSNRFCRQFTLPSPVLADKVTAKLADGMLELTLPKAEAHEPTKVAVTAA